MTPALQSPKITHDEPGELDLDVAAVRAAIAARIGEVPMRVTVDHLLAADDDAPHCDTCLCEDEDDDTTRVTVSALLWHYSKADAEADLRAAVEAAMPPPAPAGPRLPLPRRGVVA